MQKRIRFILLSALVALAVSVAGASAALAQSTNEGEGADAVAKDPAVMERELKAEIDERVINLERQIYDQNELNLRRIEYGEERVDAFERSIDRILLVFGVGLLLGFFVLWQVLSYKQRLAMLRMTQAARAAESIVGDIKREVNRPELEHLQVSQALRRLMRQLRESEDATIPDEAMTELRAAAHDPYLPASLHFIARALAAEHDGNWATAQRMLDQLRKMDAKDADVLLHLSHVHANIAARTVDARQKKNHQRAAYDFYAQFTNLIKMDGVDTAEVPALKVISTGAATAPAAITNKPTAATNPASAPRPPVATHTTAKPLAAKPSAAKPAATPPAPKSVPVPPPVAKSATPLPSKSAHALPRLPSGSGASIRRS